MRIICVAFVAFRKQRPRTIYVTVYRVMGAGPPVTRSRNTSAEPLNFRLCSGGCSSTYWPERNNGKRGYG